MGIFSSFKTLLPSKEDIKHSTQQKSSNIVDEINIPKLSVLDEKATESVISSLSRNCERNPSSDVSSFQVKDGRRYNADKSVSYILPNDDDELYRLDKQHWVLRYAFQWNFHAPIKKKLHSGIIVLDSGSGPGTWALEMAETFPESIFHCIDAAPVFPIDNRRPNVQFVLGNVAKNIPFEDNYFDYIHQRLLILGLTDDDWTDALKHMYRILKPGGYIELSEPEAGKMLHAGPDMQVLLSAFNEGTITTGIPAEINGTQLEVRLKKTGFRSIKTKANEISLNHGGRVGTFYWEDIKHTFMNLRPYMANYNPEWADVEAYEAYLDRCGDEAKESKTSMAWYSVYARKPKNDTTSAEQQEQDQFKKKKS